MQQWFVRSKSGELAGPFTPLQLKHLADSGQLKPDSDIRLGETKWAKASHVKGLFGSPEITKAVERLPSELADSSWQTVAASVPPPPPSSITTKPTTPGTSPEQVAQNQESPKQDRMLISRRGVLLILGLLLLIWSLVEFENARSVDGRWRNYQVHKQYNDSQLRQVVDGNSYQYRTPEQRSARTLELLAEARKIGKESEAWITNPPRRMSDGGMYMILGSGILCIVLSIAIRR